MIKKLSEIGIMVILLSVFITPHARSQEENKIDKLDEIVITATKSPVTLGNVTQKVDILSGETMTNRIIGNANIAEILSYEPGNFASVLSKNDANWGSSGGLPHKYKSYMVDGLPIDSFVDPQSLDILAFERIEEQRGPAAALYPNYLFMDFAGNQSALSGTTNLILKDYITEPATEIQTYFGSYTTYGARFYHQQRANNLHLFFGGHHEASDYTNYGTENSWLNMIDDPEYEKTKLYLRGAYFINDDRKRKIDFFAHRTWHKGDVGRPNRDYDHEYSTFQAGYSLPISDMMQTTIKLGYRKYQRTWEEDNYPKDLGLVSENGVDQEIVPGDIFFSLTHNQNSQMTFGGDFQFARYETFSETARRTLGNDANADQYGLYIQEEFVLSNLVLRLGGRYDHIEHDIHLLNGTPPGKNSQSWDKFLWSAGLRYSLFNTLSLYTNVGTSFLAPSLKSVGGTINLSDKGVAGKDGHLPNPDLDPEEGLGLDLGFDFQATPKLYTGIRCFYNKIDDQILQIVISDSPSQSQDINAGKTTSYGLEAEIRQNPLEWLQWFANYTYTNTEIDNPQDSDQDGAEVPFVPEHMGNIGMNVRLPYDITASVYVQMMGKIYDSTSKQGRSEFESHELLNARVEKALMKEQSLNLNLFLDLYNITNNEFEMPWQFKDPGFSATGGIKAVF